MTAVHVHYHEYSWGNHDMDIKQVRLFQSIATLVYHTHPERLHSLLGPILFSEIGFCMASCSYIYRERERERERERYVYICQDGGAVGFVDFTKLLFALSSLAQPLKRVRSIPEHFFVILSQRKACAGRFREETAGKRTGPITRWPLRRLLFTQLEIVFVTISLFIKRTKVAHKVFQEELCCL